jgi:subtilisin family serine protease
MLILFNSLITRAFVAFVLVAGTVGVVANAPPQLGPARTYVLVYSGQTEAPRVQKSIELAGAAVVAVYPNLGLAFARTWDGSFSERMRQFPGVIGVAATDKHVWRLPPGSTGLETSPGPTDTTAATAVENVVGPLTGRQWDMKMIHAPEAHAANPGSRNVVVGVIDTGIDYRHPNLVPNLDFGKSVSCIGGKPNTSPSAWDDDAGHGTHVAGTIAGSVQKAGGMGIDGVAPNVRIAAIKTGDPDGNFMLEAVVCAFTWAGNHHINVTNNSYFSDPWLYHCMNDPEQRAIWIAEKRALNYAASKGVINVAAAGNFNDDLANPTIDTISPDFGPVAPFFRRVDEDCFTFPSMVPGVITVSSVGQTMRKSYYSSYGDGIVKVTAPGGDRLVNSAQYPNGRTLSTVPHWFPAQIVDCTPSGKCGNYAWFQGTSMASPHVAGVVALILSRDGEERMSQSSVLSRLTSTADPLACPPDSWYSNILSPNMPGIPASVERHPARCEGDPGENNFYGAGLVNALRAVGGDKD